MWAFLSRWESQATPPSSLSLSLSSCPFHSSISFSASLANSPVPSVNTQVLPFLLPAYLPHFLLATALDNVPGLVSETPTVQFLFSRKLEDLHTRVPCRKYRQMKQLGLHTKPSRCSLPGTLVWAAGRLTPSQGPLLGPLASSEFLQPSPLFSPPSRWV